MFYPLVRERVRVSDREDEYIILRVDRAASVADIQLLADPEAVENGVPFRSLSSAGEAPAPIVGAHSRDGWLAAHRNLLCTADAQMHQSYALLAQLQESLLKTMESIRTSRQRIHASDRLIARAQTLGCDEDRDGDGE